MNVFGDIPRRDQQILIRVTTTEKEQLEAEAARMKITAAELIRQAVNQFLSQQTKETRKKKPK